MKNFLKVYLYQRLALIARMSVLTSLLVTLLVVPQQAAGAQGAGTTIRLVPANSRISPDGIVTTEVRLENVSSLMKIEFTLSFDSKLVQAVDSTDPSQPATRIVVGSLVEGWVMHRNEVQNDRDFIQLDCWLPFGAEPISGSGPVASITWRGIGAGTSNLTLEGVLLTNSDGMPIEHTQENGRIEVIPHTATPTPIPTPTDTPTHTPTDTPSPTHTAAPVPTTPPPDTPTFTPTATGAPSPTLTPTPSHAATATSMTTGIVLLQGRTVHAGTNILLGAEPCSGFLSGPPAAVTDDEGRFEIVPLSDQTYQCLQTSQPGYLIGQKTSPQGDLGTITLAAGDVTQDNVIDIADLTLLADHYRTTDPIADLNADGWVDIFDLTIASGNYGQSGVVTHWQ
jgi:cell division septation protein DedD